MLCTTVINMYSKCVTQGIPLSYINDFILTVVCKIDLGLARLILWTARFAEFMG